MANAYRLTAKKAMLLVLAMFLLSVCIRIPGLIRPLSRHHETITALELVAIESWQQAGGAASSHYIPMVNYQRAGDKRNPDNYRIDSNGNSVYISYGTAWNLLPYFSFALLHIKATPLALKIFNILLSGLSCFFLFGLMQVLASEKKSYTAAVLACTIFIFNPGMLWYTGNVYVNCGVAIPFILAFLYVLARMIKTPGTINMANCFILLLLVICLTGIDWIAIFLSFSTVVVLLFKIKRNKLFIYPIATIILGALAGIAIIAYQFVSFLGLQIVKNNLGFKFGQRGIPPVKKIFTAAPPIITHFVTATGPLLALLIALAIIGYVQKKKITLPNAVKWILAILLPALLLYNIVFLSWTAVHEFSILYYTVIFAILGGSLLLQILPQQNIQIALVILILATVAEYYFINPPGSKPVYGETYQSYQKIGETMAKNIEADQAIFTNLRPVLTVPYYAKSSINYAKNAADAKAQLIKFKTARGIWFEIENFRIVGIQYVEK